MLLGYDKNGDIKFIFTDENYLGSKYPNNSAKINNFWKIKDHGLTEFFIPINEFPDWSNFKQYKIIDGALIKKKEKVKNDNVVSVEKSQDVKIMNKGGENNKELLK